MDSLRGPQIKIYSRGGVPKDLGGQLTRRPLVGSDSDDDEDSRKDQQLNPMAYRIEDDLNWASKYLSNDRPSNSPRSRRSGTADDTKVSSPVAPGKYFGSRRSEDSGIFGSHGSIGRRSKSPSTFSENSEDDFGKGAPRRRDDYRSAPLQFRKSSASPVPHRNSATAWKGYMEVSGSNTRSTSPIISRPVTRTYEDLGMSRPRSLAANHVALEVARPEARTYDSFSVPPRWSRIGEESKRSGSETRIQTYPDHGVTPRNSRPVSETRKRLRHLLCRTRNDPHYFDD